MENTLSVYLSARHFYSAHVPEAMLRERPPKRKHPPPGTDSGDIESVELREAEEAYSDAEDAIMKAVAAARNAAATQTPSARKTATDLIRAARSALDEAIAKAEAAVAAAVRAADLGAATRALVTAKGRTADLDAAQDSLAWYGKILVRAALAGGDVAIPGNNANVVTIKRIPRTRDDGNGGQEANPVAFTSATFNEVIYEDGKKVFSVVDDDDGGDEFRVDGYVKVLSSSYNLDGAVHTGLKLTDAGLVIRTGGTGDASGNPLRRADFTDMRRIITRYANDPDGDQDADERPLGQNGWDLEIAFDQPQTRSVVNGHTSWTGNGDFYWKSFVRPAPSQLNANGDYYDANAFRPDATAAKQPEGLEELGTYEVWLSNYIGVNLNSEPEIPGTTAICPDRSVGTSCPDDDEYYYLDYAAYGLFVYTASTETFRPRGSVLGFNGQLGRINTIHFGYSAFGAGEGRKTTDIGEAITGGRFLGHTLAYEVSGDNNLEEGAARNGIETKLLRGDVTLTVTIPKGSGTGTLWGLINNFQRWHEKYQGWFTYTTNNFHVLLNEATISENGTFSGLASASGGAAYFLDNNNRAGSYKGSFYGPRTDRNDLEIAGSWTVGTNTNDREKDFYGSFGAKQRPPSTPASN